MTSSQSQHAEAACIELKRGHESDDQGHKLQLVCEIVAMANSRGGEIHIGVDEGKSARPGLSQAVVKALDAARVADLVESFIGNEHVEIACRHESSDDPDRQVVVVEVEAHPTPPLVFAKPGQYQPKNGKPQSVFMKGSVYVRRSTKAEPATRADFRAWITDAVDAERQLWRERVSSVASAPPGSTVQVLPPGTDVPIDEPSVLLSRGVAAWESDQAKLLDKFDLLNLLLVRDDLNLAEPEYQLLVQSALRRRPTLWFWLSMWRPASTDVFELLEIAVSGRDRDKSDAGNAIIDAAALYLSESEYRSVIDSLAGSRYKHFREAAESGNEKGAVVEKLRAARDATTLVSGPARAAGHVELERAASGLAQELLGSYSPAKGRALNSIGLELLARDLGKPK